ncbi:MAG TPA: universal stress protein [Cryptosporangiaceae bacterium]|nr:universal stress protein [Cryptosporangiaceae bacterium]
MARPGSAPVLVGVDGSEESRVAVDWAVREAVLRHRPLRLVHAWGWLPPVHVPLAPIPVTPVPVEPVEGLEQAVAELLDAEVERARALAPGHEISGELARGAASNVLLERAEDSGAVLLAIGHRGLGGFAGLLVGSVGVQLTAHAPCPVVVVRQLGVPNGPSVGQVVTGVDGSPRSVGALAFAFEEASLHGQGLTAVHAWQVPETVFEAGPIPAVYDMDAASDAAARVLAEALAGWQDAYPDVRVERRVVHAAPAKALLDHAKGAELLVVGTRGRGGFTGLLFGSVSQAALHHAPCPVAVVRHAAQ